MLPDTLSLVYKAAELRAQGLTQQAIGELLGKSTSRVAMLLAMHKRLVSGVKSEFDGLTVRAANVLHSENLLTKDHVVEYILSNKPQALLLIPNLGAKTFKEIMAWTGVDPDGLASDYETYRRKKAIDKAITLLQSFGYTVTRSCNAGNEVS